MFALQMFNEKEVTKDQDQEPTRLHASSDAKAIASLGKPSFAGLAESEGPPCFILYSIVDKHPCVVNLSCKTLFLLLVKLRRDPAHVAFRVCSWMLAGYSRIQS